jgi:modulator of FtsH protease
MMDQRMFLDGFRPDAWTAFYAAVAGAAAALTGLLFVAFSLNLGRITGSAMHMGRSREVLATLLILLMLSIAVLIPGQANQALGIELIVGALLVLGTSIRNQRRTIGMLQVALRAPWARRNLILNAGTGAILLGGISLVIGDWGGLYWLLLTVGIYFPWAVVNAWLLVVRVGQASGG